MCSCTGGDGLRDYSCCTDCGAGVCERGVFLAWAVFDRESLAQFVMAMVPRTKVRANSKSKAGTGEMDSCIHSIIDAGRVSK